uniref:Retrovirus-related Pol polyprotein from transposon TNT 1-94 n=1 Tax=Tanacetum cinerariifolium TaxID=118510 RepID=A0A6L2LJ19_TANCI|nr:retrovirus-related Pol polyprotein from transposon TNT 1-94 [Tanacetum cinerariifolium]
MDKGQSIGTPMATKPKLDADLSGNPVDQTDYRSKIGSFMYLTSSRPDIVQAVCFCTRYKSRLTEKHLKEVKRIFRYLRGTVHMGLWYLKGSSFELTAFLDADHAGCIDTCKSTSRGIQFLGDNLKPQHIDEFDLKDKTSLIEYDEVEQNVLYFNYLFPFNIIYLDDLKSGKDNDDNEIDIIQSSGVMMLLNVIKNLYVPFGIPFDPKRYYKDDVYTRLLRRLSEKFLENPIPFNLCFIFLDSSPRDMAPIPPRNQRHLWLCYQVEGYTEKIVHDFEQKLETIFERQVNRVHILDFEGLSPDMRQDLAERLRMVYTGDDGQEIFMSHTWRRISSEMRLDATNTLCFQLRGARRSMTWRQFILALGLNTTKETVEDGFEAYWLGSERVIPNKGDLSGYWIEISSDMDFVIRSLLYLHQRSAQYLFRHGDGRKSNARLLRGDFIGRLAHHFGLVSDDELRGLYVVTRELPLIDMGELVKLNIFMEDVRSLRGLIERSMTDQGRFSTWMISCMTQLIEASGRTYQAFDGTFQGSYLEVFERLTRRRNNGSLRDIATKGDLSGYWSKIAYNGDFLEAVPSYTSIRDPLRRLCHRLIAMSISGKGQTLEKAEGRKHGARMLGGHFVRRLVEHSGLVTKGDPAPAQGPPTVVRAMPQMMAKLEEEVHGL